MPVGPYLALKSSKIAAGVDIPAAGGLRAERITDGRSI
jgi:hypothetical protein